MALPIDVEAGIWVMHLERKIGTNEICLVQKSTQVEARIHVTGAQPH